MFNLHILLQLAIALAVGLIIGLERGWSHRAAPEGNRIAGVRTFAITALAGGGAALLPAPLAGVAVAAFLGLALLVTAAYMAATRRDPDFGITTEVTLLVTFLLGALSADFPLETVSVSVLLALLLGTKQEMHRALAALDRTEFMATLQLLVVAAVLLPLLPDRNLGPWQAINPRVIGWLVLLVLGISYTGYFAGRLVGANRGLQITAALGGLTSSTVVTLAYARMARQKIAPERLLGAGIALACSMMAPRVLLQVAVVNPSLLPYLVIPIATLGVLPLAFALFAGRGTSASATKDSLQIRNPLAIKAALALAVGLVVLNTAVRAAGVMLGESGVYAVAAISGLLDVDAVTVSLARSAGNGINQVTAAHAIVVAAVMNTWLKAVMTLVVGGHRLAKTVGATLVGSGILAAALTVMI